MLLLLTAFTTTYIDRFTAVMSSQPQYSTSTTYSSYAGPAISKQTPGHALGMYIHVYVCVRICSEMMYSIYCCAWNDV